MTIRKIRLFANGRNIAMIRAFIFASAFMIPQISQAQGTQKITPGDVFGIMELVNKRSEILLKAKKTAKPAELKMVEKELGPMHVYQLAVACIDMIIEFEKKEGIRPIPKVVATPRKYIPGDVKLLADILLAETHRILNTLGIYDFPRENEQFYDKTPTDVFEKVLGIFVKFSMLAGMEEITADEVFSQMMRAVSDVKSILSQIDPVQRFRIDAPVNRDDLTPTHVFRESLLIRKDINKLRKYFGMKTIPVPEIRADQMHPADVFIQTQIIISELNLLKMETGTISSTPLPIPVSGKTPGDVYQQAVMIRYLLTQVKPLQEMIRQLKK